jgi:uncharacterized membrane protein YraQ (UPF0718 family)
MMNAVLRALGMAFAVGWQILWPLVLGFALSAVVQAVVSHREMARLLPDDRPRSIATALALGAASSSCSYAAVALARSLFRKGADFTAAMAFEMASTNLVLELGIIMLAFLGWQLTLAELVGAPIMVGLLILLFRWFLNREQLAASEVLFICGAGLGDSCSMIPSPLIFDRGWCQTSSNLPRLNRCASGARGVTQRRMPTTRRHLFQRLKQVLVDAGARTSARMPRRASCAGFTILSGWLVGLAAWRRPVLNAQEVSRF